MNSSQQQQQQRQQQQQHQQRLHEERFEKAMMDHLQRYPMGLNFPPKISSMEKDGRLRTKSEFIYSKLQKILLVPNNDQQQKMPLSEVTQRLDATIQELEGTGCYDSVQFHLKPNQEWNVLLKEKPWYKLYIGGGIKGDPLSEGGDLQTTKLQAETSIGLRNLTGHCDMTNFTYAVDQTSTPNLQFTHDAPLSAYIPSSIPLALQIKAMADTLDHTYTRSCRERISQLQVALKHHDTAQEFTWTTALRDIMPRRHLSLPYTCDASLEILKQAGPSLKHSLKYSNPLLHMEVAGPPGDVGFFKCWFATSHDVPLQSSTQTKKYDIQFHMALQGGYLHPLSFGGLCSNKNQLSDKFFVGGPNQLRGFLPSGIGPRSKTVSMVSFFFFEMYIHI